MRTTGWCLDSTQKSKCLVRPLHITHLFACPKPLSSFSNSQVRLTPLHCLRPPLHEAAFLCHLHCLVLLQRPTQRFACTPLGDLLVTALSCPHAYWLPRSFAMVLTQNKYLGNIVAQDMFQLREINQMEGENVTSAAMIFYC